MALDGPGSEGLTRRQTYTVTEIRGHRRTRLFDGQTLVAVPSNVGSATMPNYESLAAQGIYREPARCAAGTEEVRVFAGQRAETFYIDLGAVFDTLNLRRYLPLLSAAEDVDNVNPFGKNRFAKHQHQHHRDRGADQVPHRRGQDPGRDQEPGATENPVIGVYASTSRQKVPRAPTTTERPTTTGPQRAGRAHGQSARERADHQHPAEGPVERDRPRGRGPVPGLLQEPGDRDRTRARVRGAGRAV